MSRSWTEDRRFETRRAKPQVAPPAQRGPRPASQATPARQPASRPQTAPFDPFESSAGSASQALEPGWLVGATFPPPSEVHEEEDSRTWKQRAAELGGRLLDVERRATARLWAPRYPLANTRHLAGLPPEDRARLARAFRDSTPPRHWRSRTAALEHLESLLPTWPLRNIANMSGVHVFLGAAGSGKTTLVLKAAHQLTRAGRRVGLISLFPQSPERMAAFREAALRVPAPALMAHQEAQLDEAVESLARCDAILVDTPCLLSQPARSRQIARLRLMKHPGSVLHYSLCLHHARAFRRREMAAANAHGVDFLALSHVDLAPGPGALLAVQLHTPQRISLANAYPDVNDPLVPFGAPALLRALGQPRRD